MPDISIKIPEYAQAVMDRLCNASEQVYIVGGSLRDALLGLPAHDYDMATSALPSRMREIFSDMRVIDTGIKHGTITVLSEGNPIEITTFRIDGEYSDSRRPDSVSFTRSLGEDLARRDFTVNALAYSREGKLIDLFFGREDLDARLIRAVGVPEKRFSEDALRIMRAFRFSAQLGFDIESSTLIATHTCRGGLASISRERIGIEFLKLICSSSPKKSLELMCKYEIMPYVMGNYNPDSKLFSLLEQMPTVDIARLGVLLVNTDKEKARAILSGLKCSNKQKAGALAVVQGAKMSVCTPEDATHLRATVGEYAELALRASVLLKKSPASASELLKNSVGPSKISELALGGRELMDIGFSGKELGDMLEYLLFVTMHTPELNTKKSLLRLANKKFKERS